MADQRTMAQLLQAPTEGYEDAIVVPAITAFELKHSLLTLVQNKQFFGHDKEDPHAHVRYFNKITSTLKFQNATATVHHHSIWFKMDNTKHIVNLETFSEMLHICPRLPGQTFVEPPFEEEILAFLRFLGHSGAIRRLTDVEHKDTKKSNEMYYLRFTKVIIYHLMSKDPSIPRRNKVNWHYVRDDHMFTMIKLVSKHQNTQQFGAMLPIELINADIRKSDAYKEYYAVATGATPPKPKASVRKIKSNEGTSTIPWVPNVPTDESEKEISWNSTDEEGDDDEGDDGEEGNDDDAQDDDDQEDEGNDKDYQEEGSDDEQAFDEEEFIHPGLSTHAEEETRDDESFDPIPKTPENTNDEGNGEENLGMNVGREEGQDEEDEENELYKDVNINLGRGIQMGDVHTTQEFKDSHVTLTLTPTSVDPLHVPAPTLTPSTIATITTTQQAPTHPKTALSTLLQDLPSFGSLFGFDHRLKTLEANLSEFMQTNQLRDEAQAENDKFLKTIDENMQKIIKEQVKVQVSKILPKIKQNVNEQLEAEVLTRSSNSSKTSYAVAADLSEMELKKILIEEMEGNKSIHQSNEQRNLYKALVEAYESDKIILDTYRDTVTLKRRRDDDADKYKEPSAGLDQGSKRRREGKELESTSAPKEKATRSAGKSTQGSKSRQTSASKSAIAEEPMQTTIKMEEPSHPEFETDRDWNKTLPATHGSIQPWISKLAKQSDSRSSFNELMDTPMDLSAFLMNRLKVDTLTPELLAGPTYKLMKGSYKSLVELEFFLEEVYKATTDQLDWVNPEGQQYPHNLLKPLPLIPNSRGHRVIPFDHFINNDLEYLHGGASSRKYTTSVTKTKAADYGHIKWIEDLVPRTMWIQEPVGYDKHALWEISHWGRKRQQFYGFAVNWESARDVYSKRRIIAVTELKIVEWHNYKHLDWIMVRKDDDKLYKFKEGDFKRLRIQDIEDMLLLLVQGKLTNMSVEERFPFNVSLRMFTRSIVIQRRVGDLQLGVESYQKKLNITKPNTYRSDLKHKEAYITYSNPRGFIYHNKDKQNRLIRIDELHKFNDGALTDVRTALDDRLKGIRMKYLPQSIWRKSDKDRVAAMIQTIDKILKTRRTMRSLERSILTDLQVTPTKPGRMTKPYSSHRFIANCFNAENLKIEVKVALMANLSHYGSDNLAEVNNFNNMSTHLIHQEMHIPSTSEQSTILAQSNTESTSDSNIISYSKYMNETQYNTVQNSTLPASQDDLK
nr:reverse transcriptase domain-containing protein [Tanacetum cinerariifolium]